MDLSLRNKVVLVTGGARGIGAVICKAFATESAKVGINYCQNREKAEMLAGGIGRHQAAPVQGDIGKEADIAVWAGNPLQVGAQPERVFVRGVQVIGDGDNVQMAYSGTGKPIGISHGCDE